MIDPQNIAAILLAAGGSARFGRDNKLLAMLDGEPLVLHAAHRIIELNPGRKIAVCASGGDIADLLRRFGFEIVYNDDPRDGMSKSLARGVEAVGPHAMAALVSLGDMPFVGLGHLQEILARFDPVDAPIVASKTKDVAMPPALFARKYFDTLRTGTGDRGARTLLGSAIHVRASAKELADIDTIDDLRRFMPRRAIDPGTCPA